MKIWSALALSMAFTAPALAQRAPDALVVTGPNMQQLPIGTLLVTPAGGTQMSLKNALAFGANLTMPGPIGSVTPNTGAFTTINGATLSGGTLAGYGGNLFIGS